MSVFRFRKKILADSERTQSDESFEHMKPFPTALITHVISVQSRPILKSRYVETSAQQLTGLHTVGAARNTHFLFPLDRFGCIELKNSCHRLLMTLRYTLVVSSWESLFLVD